MSVVEELLRKESDGTLSFGNYQLEQKTKLSDFEHNGDIYKVKTFKEITKLEKNDMLLYESDPGTAVNGFAETEEGVTFTLDTPADAQVILGLEEDTEYRVTIGNDEADIVKTTMGGKLVLSIEAAGPVKVEVKKVQG